MTLDPQEILARISRLHTEVTASYAELETIPASDPSGREKIWHAIKNTPLELSLIRREVHRHNIHLPDETQTQLSTIDKMLAELTKLAPVENLQPTVRLNPGLAYSTPVQSLTMKQSIKGLDDWFYSRKSWLAFLITGIVIIIAASVSIGFGGFKYAKYVIEGVVGLYLTILIFFNPELGAYIILVTTISSLSDVFTTHGLPSINQPLVMITFVCILANQILQTGRVTFFFKPTKVEWSILAYYLVITASIYVADDRSRAISIFGDFTKNLILLYSIFTTLNSPKKIKTGIWIVIITASILSLFGVYQWITGDTIHTFGGLAMPSTLGQVNDQGVLRYSGPIGDANIWPQILAAVLPLAVYRFIDEKSPLIKFSALGAVLVIIGAIFYTYSRGAFVTLVVMAFVIAIERRMDFSKFTLVIALGLVVLFFAPQGYRDRIFGLFDTFKDTSTTGSVTDESISGRINEMRVGVAMFKAHPFLGVGVGNYTSEYWSYAPALGLESDVLTTDVSTNSRQAHSLIVEVLAETGLFGIITFGIFVIVLFTTLWKNRNKHGEVFNTSLMVSMTMAVLSYLISGLFLHGVLYRWFWIFIALALAGLHMHVEEK